MRRKGGYSQDYAPFLHRAEQLLSALAAARVKRNAAKIEAKRQPRLKRSAA